jgi:hypothetical protein
LANVPGYNQAIEFPLFGVSRELIMNRIQSSHRRSFLRSAAAGAAALVCPTIWIPRRSKRVAVWGQGPFEFEFIHTWAQLPSQYNWQTTHNVAVDSDGLVYVIHEGRAEQREHPSIFVFDPDGTFVRAFGQQFQGGGHGIEVRREANQDFLYVAAYQQVKSIAKLDTRGETVWQKYAPMEAGIYAAKEDTERTPVWGRDRFMPTNFAFLPGGDFFLADGYGSFYIHRYDKDGNWKSCFGGPGEGDGKFNTPHGLWIDDRNANQAELIVTDRAHHTLQYFSLDGKYLRTQTGFGLPANVDRQNDLLLVPELLGRVTLLGKDNAVVAQLGDDAARVKTDEKFAIRGDSGQWHQGKFVHPHDACFDRDGNIYVAEWVATGRVSKLKRLR